jgi:hypothetical protein
MEGIRKARAQKLVALAVVLALGAVMTVATPAPQTAEASTFASTIAGTAGVRDCVTTSRTCGTPFATLSSGTRVRMVCWVDGSSFTGRYTSNRWFRVRSSTGVEGYVHSSNVTSQTRVGSCTSMADVNAALRAANRVGQKYASTTDRQMFSTASWHPGPVGEWSGDCPKLGHVAWRGARTLPSGNAIVQYRFYRDRGRIKQGTPPAGALVFYDVARPYGHVAVSLGGGRIATTIGLDWAEKPNARVRMSHFGNYLGWAMP